MDSPYYIQLRLGTLALVAALWPQALSAGAISNMTPGQQVIEIQTREGYVAHIIPPGRTWHVMGGAKIKFSGKEFYLEDDMEYAMWPGGVFGPQRKLYKNRR